jgi:hypothetical protein
LKAAPSVLFLPSHPCWALVAKELRIRVEPRSFGNVRKRRDPVKPDRCFKRLKSVKTQSFDDLIGVY